MPWPVLEGIRPLKGRSVHPRTFNESVSTPASGTLSLKGSERSSPLSSS